MPLGWAQPKTPVMESEVPGLRHDTVPVGTTVAGGVLCSLYPAWFFGCMPDGSITTFSGVLFRLRHGPLPEKGSHIAALSKRR
jgi:hypothetical protein